MCFGLLGLVLSESVAPTVEESREDSTDAKSRKKGRVFPKNPDDLLPDLPRDKKGRIYTSDNTRIRPERHEMEPGETYNPRHHGQHYHIDTREDTSCGWNGKRATTHKPKGYIHQGGTGFLPGETFPL